MKGSKICMNTSCRSTSSREWKTGWPMRSGGYARLCYTCGSAYENLVYCDTFHGEQSGWRECSTCNKRLHCGCVASKFSFELLDFGGVGCTSCSKNSELQLTQTGEISNRFSSLAKHKAGNLGSTLLENRVTGSAVNEGKLAQLCSEAHEFNLMSTFDGAESDGGLAKFIKEEVKHPIGDATTCFSNPTPSSGGTSKFVKPDSTVSVLDMKDMNGPLARPSLRMNFGASLGSSSFVPYSCGVVERMERGKTFAFQQGQRSRPILPKPSKPSFAVSSETNKAVVPKLRIARPPADSRGKNQLLPRYWPRITDQELQQLSGNLNSNIVPLFEKVLSASDAGRIGRLVLPKACAEAYFPPISQSEGLPLRVQDVKGREWTFQFRFWPNNNSRMYVLEGVTPCIQSMQLKAGDTITFSRIDPGGKLVVGFRKATNNTSEDAQTSSALHNSAAVAETSFSADGGNVWNKSENNGSMVNADTMQQPTPEKKRTRNIGPKSKRLLMHSDDALELQLTWEEAQDLLRPPPSVKPNIIIIEDYEFEEYDEPPVFGKRTIFADCPSGGQDQWAQCDDCSKWRKLPEDVLLPPKWTCSENVWDSSRCSCSASEEMSRKDLDNLFRVIRDFKKQRIVDRHKPSPECEPSGLDALASAAVLGDIMSGLSEPSTTKHPRHRPGCSCIVCIQPPSGKGKHKPTCTCNVCMTVKRRFKTLMLRKKQRQSEREAESSHRDEESAIAGAMNLAVLHIDDSEHDGIQSRKQPEVDETSAGQIDLNCDPDRNDIHFDIAGLGMMTLADPADTPFDSGMKQKSFTNLMCERQGSLESCLHSQTNGENMRRMPDEAFLAWMGWNMKNGGD